MINKPQNGFTLIEILVSMFLVLPMLMILVFDQLLGAFFKSYGIAISVVIGYQTPQMEMSESFLSSISIGASYMFKFSSNWIITADANFFWRDAHAKCQMNHCFGPSFGHQIANLSAW